ncbi:TPA: DUF4153 domain-containing protein [Streptococcus suis]
MKVKSISDQTISPINPALSPTKNRIAQLTPAERQVFNTGRWLSYLLAYLYIYIFFDYQPRLLLLFSLGMIALVELGQFLSTEKRLNKPNLESIIFASSCLLQALALSIWDFRESIEMLQLLALHTSFVCYVLARNGWLVQGRIGVLFWYDVLQGFILLPFKHFLLRLHFATFKEDKPEQTGQSLAHFRFILLLTVSSILTFFLVYFVWQQLSQVSQTFSLATSDLGKWIDNFIQGLLSGWDFNLLFGRFIFSLPVGAWLFGLVAGSLLYYPKKSLTYSQFQDQLKPLRIFPTLSVYLLLGSLLTIYLLFFVTSLTEIGDLLALNGISPQTASTVAVTGFWQLVRVCLVNFAVLAGAYIFADKPLWERKSTRLLLTLVFISASLFALLAAWKLFGIYIYLYGPTPLRLLSGWFITVLIVWCALALIRFHKPIQAIRYAIFYALISFTLLTYLHPIILG